MRSPGGDPLFDVDDVRTNLLPTPTATDARASGGVDGLNVTLTDVTARRLRPFGQYAPAVARWEAILGREAPPPTLPDGQGGRHRLNPLFVEWMMGLPEGWVTAVDVPRVVKLRALGNGVVPQQAALAIAHLLSVWDEP